MIYSLIWKEYREHRTVWLIMAVVNSALLFLLSSLEATIGLGLSGDSPLVILGPTAFLLVWAYGMVAGSMVLAGEREASTLDFLDILPETRLGFWIAKAAIGFFLTLGQALVLSLCLIGLRDSAHAAPELWPFLLLLPFLGAIGLAWGLLFSARGANVLRTLGWAILGQIGAILVASILTFLVQLLWFFVAIKFGERTQSSTARDSGSVLMALSFCGLTVTALVGSARIFTRPDRLRRRLAGGRRLSDVSRWASWGRLLWLSWIQMRRLLLGLSVFALLGGVLMQVLDQPLFWPVSTLLIGVLCGVAVCADEQTSGAFRFLGDQRFPLGRIWCIKTGMGFAVALICAFVLLLPSTIMAIAHDVGSNRRDTFFDRALHWSLVGSVVPIAVHLTMWLLHGFIFGHLCGLLFRKSLVAVAAALGAASLLLCLWVPSLMGIGLQLWQIASAPLILLATAGLLMAAWTAERLLARGIIARVGLSVAAVGLCTALTLWYRIAEIPDVPDAFNMPAFVASLPSPEENKAGQDIRGAWGEVETMVKSLASTTSPKPLFPDPAAMNGPPAVGKQKGEPLQNQIGQVADRGWPDGPSVLGDWLDRTFRGKPEWLARLADAADQPLGMVEDPRLLTILDNFMSKWPMASEVYSVLAARGLQQQTRGDHRSFVDHLRIGLALSRNLQHHAPQIPVFSGIRAEATWLPALDRWLEKLSGDGQAELLARVRRILAHHDAELPDLSETIKAEYLIALNTLERDPGLLIKLENQSSSRGNAQKRQEEIDVAALLWRVPWEQERHRRILRVIFQGSRRQQAKIEEAGGLGVEGLIRRRDFSERSDRVLCRLRAGQLKVALRLYQIETGKPAVSLDALVPSYVLAIPLDPFGDKPFRYRLSRGENIGWPSVGPPAGIGAGRPGMLAGNPPPTRFVPKGHGILWSVGEDRVDDGGVKQSESRVSTQFGEDIIFLVPPAKRLPSRERQREGGTPAP